MMPNRMYVIVDWSERRLEPYAFTRRAHAERTLHETYLKVGGATVTSIPADAPKETEVAYETKNDGRIWVIISVEAMESHTHL